ncbi:hypothetical protein [Pseudobutyrivibrio sp. YE44]|uniref:hypothetical protein n=1 Tax=Pseudobutyrivibrio sp. YE44 TaxID=1520802 RepID=UPI000A8F8258|nr:hypothetical protein [Pseudobutyrivibrio sp. YE44]
MKILFIGNSHTYMNDMPELTRLMIEDATGEACEVFMLAYSGRSLKWHMEEEYFSERFNILHGNYDYCVIQEQAHPMGSEEDTIKYATRIVELCNQVGTSPIIFETWAEKVKPENQIEMNRRYRSLADKLNVSLAPIGEVWSKILNTSDIELYFRDGEHASATGDYLIAMVLTKVITGKLPSADFLTAFDFTVPDRFWPVKEKVEDEVVKIDSDIINIIRSKVEEFI